MSSLYDRFLAHVPSAGSILDAGCGIGRDAGAFADRGFKVVGFDASPEMVRLARGRAGAQVEIHLMRFEDVAWKDAFDGILACASLLHVTAADFPSVATRLACALRGGGAMYMSFKLGAGERMAGGRRFTDHTAETLGVALRGTGLVLVEAWITADVRIGRDGERWLNAIVTKPET
ncbi:class I SAM-dependent methyltransferase [Humitalea sp. 24SJ18S-53]|uniref:class I SAM-dependent methyltransferase n=1 Tax=Humitalea sp. 24SJ18S-53 TaxID=3422307 RepID=UPI003D67D4C8